MTWVKRFGYPSTSFLQYSAGILAHSSWQNWCNWVRFVGHLARTRLQICPQIFDGIQVRALGWPLQDTPICAQVLASCLMSWDVALIFPGNVLSSWWRLFYEELQFLLQQNSPTTWCCHLHASQLGWCSQVYKLPPFPPNVTVVIMAKQLHYSFLRPQDISRS